MFVRSCCVYCTRQGARADFTNASLKLYACLDHTASTKFELAVLSQHAQFIYVLRPVFARQAVQI